MVGCQVAISMMSCPVLARASAAAVRAVLFPIDVM
jgi:hypothetical protein